MYLQGPDSLEQFLRACKETMDGITCQDGKAYGKSHIRSEGLMLSATAMIAFNGSRTSLEAAYRRFCQGNDLVGLDLTPFKLEQYDICLWNDNVGQKMMVTGFEAAPVPLESLLGLPTNVSIIGDTLVRRPLMSSLCLLSWCVFCHFADWLLSIQVLERVLQRWDRRMGKYRLDMTFGIQCSEDKFAPLREVQMSFDAFCDEGGRERETITAALLAKHNMHITIHQGQKVVTGLEHVPFAE